MEDIVTFILEHEDTFNLNTHDVVPIEGRIPQKTLEEIVEMMENAGDFDSVVVRLCQTHYELKDILALIVSAREYYSNIEAKVEA